MIANRLTYWLTVYAPIVSENETTGEEGIEYRQIKTIRADRVSFRGSYSHEVGEHFPDYRAEWNVRSYHSDIREQWRVRDEDGILYTVTNIERHRRAGMLKLFCERVNE